MLDTHEKLKECQTMQQVTEQQLAKVQQVLEQHVDHNTIVIKFWIMYPNCTCNSVYFLVYLKFYTM